MNDATRTQPPAENLTATRDPHATHSEGEGAVKVHEPLPEIPGYAILGYIRAGGMGTVYKAMQIRMNRVVALKLIHGGKTASPKELIRFLVEAEAVAAIEHPHVVKVYDTGDAGGHPFLAMEYLSGGSLSELLASRERQRPENSLEQGTTTKSSLLRSLTLPARQVAELIAKLALAVQAAHDRQIVHRDLKPSNILFDANGEPRVVDFGLAKRAGGGDLTNTNAIMGTAAYMAPEQARGESKFVGPAADVWALGVILYECLIGVRPFTGNGDFEVIKKVIEAEPSSIRSHAAGVPRDLELIAKKCLAKEPAKRYVSAKALADDLQNWLTGRPVSVKAAGVVEKSIKWVRRNKIAAAIMAASLGISLLTTILLIRTVQAEQRSNEFRALKEEAERQRTRADNEVHSAIVANAELLAVADERQFEVSFPNIARHPDSAIPALMAILNAEGTGDDKERLAKQQANAAVALLRMGLAEIVWPLLKHSPDPRVRSYLIHKLAPLGADANVIVARLGVEPDVSIRQALLLSLGEFSEAQFSVASRQALLPKLQELYRHDPDAGLHSAVEWLLRIWKQEDWLKQVNAEWARTSRERKRPENANWHVNSQGHTMITIAGPVTFAMGSPKSELVPNYYTRQHQRRIDRSFAIAAKPVTLEQFRAFQTEHKAEDFFSTGSIECPVVDVSWHQAAAYCNWLSEKEGLQPCYVLDDLGEVTAMKPDFLKLNGYRLPTEAEMEYAMRAGTTTSYSFGETDELLPHYAWYEKNSHFKVQPVGGRMPNHFGGFDVHGNVWNWCQSARVDYPKESGDTILDDADDGKVDEEITRAVRGGGFLLQSLYACSSLRNHFPPAHPHSNVGFRVARTVFP